jgi:flagellar motor switch protein FliM
MSSASSNLSGEEVSALMQEFDDTGVMAVQTETQPFQFGRESARPAPRLAGMERMGERFARRLRTVVEPMARTKAQVNAETAEVLRFDDWRADLPDFTSLSLYRLRPLKGNMLIAIEPGFISALVDAFYGGTGTPLPHKGFELSAGEERLLGRLTEALIEILVDVWAEIAPLAPVLASRETNAAYASLVRPEEMVVIQRFTVSPGAMKPGTISILYPLATLRPIEAQLAVKVHDDHGPVDGEWRSRLAAALEQVRLPVRSVLARPEISVAQLMALKPGDVIPITLSPTAPLIVGQKVLARGSIGEQEGRAALMVEQVSRDK